MCNVASLMIKDLIMQNTRWRKFLFLWRSTKAISFGYRFVVDNQRMMSLDSDKLSKHGIVC